MIKLFEIVILWVYYTIPFGFSLFSHVWDITFQFLKLLLWLRTTDEGSVPEMRIWSILLIKSDLKWCIHISRRLFLYFNRESKVYLCTLDKVGLFSNKKYDSYKCWTCTEFSEAFTFLMENIYEQFDDMVYQQIVGIIADLFLYSYDRDFMSNLQKSKRFDLIDKFNDTSRYLDDIFTIDNLAFAEHIPDIYPRELQLNKANTSDKETYFLDLNIKHQSYWK